ncbi:MAG: type II toxin-antitoxin system VapC family toxin [Candidatus Rokuibacteriota bacterium]
MVLGLARLSPRPRSATRSFAVTLLLDTHFLIWLVLRSKRLSAFPWIDRYRPWGVSPVSFLEIQFLSGIGRLSVRNPEFVDAVMDDPRFTVDDVPLVTLVRHALKLDWTRDPFDRLLVAHSSARRVPLCTLDRGIRTRHALLPAELTRS